MNGDPRGVVYRNDLIHIHEYKISSKGYSLNGLYNKSFMDLTTLTHQTTPMIFGVCLNLNRRKK